MKDKDTLLLEMAYRGIKRPAPALPIKALREYAASIIEVANSMENGTFDDDWSFVEDGQDFLREIYPNY